MESRYPLLDALRAIAVLLVVLFHANNCLDDSAAWIRPFLGTGWNGVYLFFVLSGFLVSNLALSEVRNTGTLCVSRFWMRRILRTWPLYIILLVLYISKVKEVSPPLIHYLTFTQNFYVVKFFTATWSLAVEEQFYFVFPLVILLFVKARKLYLIPVLGVVGFLSAFLFRHLYGASTHSLAVLDSIWVGFLISCCNHFYPRFLEPIKKYSKSAVFIGIGIVYLPFLLPEPSHAREVLLVGGFSVGFGLIVVGALDEKVWKIPTSLLRALSFVALVSYSIYLSEDRPLFRVAKMAESLALKGWVRTGFILAVGILGSILVGTALYYCIEKPALIFRERYFPRIKSKP